MPNHRDLSVFINCPYDAAYQPVFDGLIFATICCGFIPRCAIDGGHTSEPRIHTILKSVKNSRYSVHDLSRCRGEGDANLARFNMPLELGFAMAQRFEGAGADDQHDWLALVPNGHSYGAYISDLAGYDPKRVDGTPETTLPAVMSWLATRSNAIQTPTPQKVLEALPPFSESLKYLREDWRGHEPWSNVVAAAVKIAEERAIIVRKMELDMPAAS